jgi:hypothetical protein
MVILREVITFDNIDQTTFNLVLEMVLAQHNIVSSQNWASLLNQTKSN